MKYGGHLKPLQVVFYLLNQSLRHLIKLKMNCFKQPINISKLVIIIPLQINVFQVYAWLFLLYSKKLSFSCSIIHCIVCFHSHLLLFLSDGTWLIESVTGGRRGPDGPLDLVVVFCGQNAESKPLPLQSNKENPYQIGLTDNFKVEFLWYINHILCQEKIMHFTCCLKDLHWGQKRLKAWNLKFLHKSSDALKIKTSPKDNTEK
jgi:hypothetical protein